MLFWIDLHLKRHGLPTRAHLNVTIQRPHPFSFSVSSSHRPLLTASRPHGVPSSRRPLFKPSPPLSVLSAQLPPIRRLSTVLLQHTYNVGKIGFWIYFTIITLLIAPYKWRYLSTCSLLVTKRLSFVIKLVNLRTKIYRIDCQRRVESPGLLKKRRFCHLCSL